ncbi:MAG: TPM domain-containing protein, partial [Spirosomataceae bacterium]
MLKRNLLCWLLLCFAGVALGQDIPDRPSPPRLVNDFVGNLLSSQQINSLERKLVAYNDSTSTQIVVVIVDSVEPYDMNTYALELGRKWGVGQKGKNNGIVLLWAPRDRKVYIATGYGMEGALPDAYANRIVDQVIIPRFKEIKYYEGLDAGIDTIMKYASGEY